MTFSRGRIVALFAVGWILLMAAVFSVMFSGHVMPGYGAPGRALPFSQSFIVLAVLFYLVNFVSAASVLFYGRDPGRITDFRASGIVALVMAVVFIIVSPLRFFITTGELTGLDGPLAVAGFVVFVVSMNSLLVHALGGRVIEAAAFSTVSVCGAVAVIYIWMKSIIESFEHMPVLPLAVSMVAFGLVGVCLFKIASVCYGMSARLADMKQNRGKPVHKDAPEVSEGSVMEESLIEERILDGGGL